MMLPVLFEFSRKKETSSIPILGCITYHSRSEFSHVKTWVLAPRLSHVLIIQYYFNLTTREQKGMYLVNNSYTTGPHLSALYELKILDTLHSVFMSILRKSLGFKDITPLSSFL